MRHLVFTLNFNFPTKLSKLFIFSEFRNLFLKNDVITIQIIDHSMTDILLYSVFDLYFKLLILPKYF